MPFTATTPLPSTTAQRNIARNTYCLLGVTLLAGACTSTLMWLFNVSTAVNTFFILLFAGLFCLLPRFSLSDNATLWSLLLAAIGGAGVIPLIGWFVGALTQQPSGTLTVSMAVSCTAIALLSAAMYTSSPTRFNSRAIRITLTGILVSMFFFITMRHVPLTPIEMISSVVLCLALSALVLRRTYALLRTGETRHGRIAILLQVHLGNAFIGGINALRGQPR